MRLKYRGISYESTVVALPLASRIIGQYRGVEVSTCFLTEPLHQYTIRSLVYRGVRYGYPVIALQDYVKSASNKRLPEGTLKGNYSLSLLQNG